MRLLLICAVVMLLGALVSVAGYTANKEQQFRDASYWTCRDALDNALRVKRHNK